MHSLPHRVQRPGGIEAAEAICSSEQCSGGSNAPAMAPGAAMVNAQVPGHL